jgi:hypothetical protein
MRSDMTETFDTIPAIAIAGRLNTIVTGEIDYPPFLDYISWGKDSKEEFYRHNRDRILEAIGYCKALELQLNQTLVENNNLLATINDGAFGLEK